MCANAPARICAGGAQQCAFLPRFRATAAATAPSEGPRPEAVRDWLGHSNLAATALYYRRPASNRMSPTFRISYPKPRPVQESEELSSFSAGVRTGASAGQLPGVAMPARTEPIAK